jgi:hypothetical protein
MKELSGTFTMCGLPHKIYVVDDVQQVMVEDYGELCEKELAGVYLSEHKVILIDEKLPIVATLEVLAHECMHAIHITHQIELTESQVQSLALGMFELFTTMRLDPTNESEQTPSRPANKKRTKQSGGRKGYPARKP